MALPLDNPFVMPNPFGDPFGAGTPAPRPTAVSPLTPEEQDSLLSRIGSGALHGLGWLGGSMSKALGGRAIRGLLGGRPEELASIIPFSDTLGITNPENEVHGSDLLGGNKDTSFFSPEGIGGFGLDVLTDPATYLTLGAGSLTKLGKAAQMANVLPKNIGGTAGRIAGLAAGSPEATALAEHLTQLTGKATSAAEVAGQRLGGHLGFHVPFTDIGTTFDLTGPGRAISNAVGMIPGAAPVGNFLSDQLSPIARGARALFDRKAAGFADPIFQPEAIANAERSLTAANEARKAYTPIGEFSQNLIEHQLGKTWGPEHVAASRKMGPELLNYIERAPLVEAGTIHPDQLAVFNAAKEKLGDGGVQLAEMARKQYADILEKNIAAGLADKAKTAKGYAFLQTTQNKVENFLPKEQGASGKLMGNLFAEGDAPGQMSINSLSKKAELQDMKPDAAAKWIRENVLGMTAEDEATHKALKSQLDRIKVESEAVGSLNKVATAEAPKTARELATIGETEANAAYNRLDTAKANLRRLKTEFVNPDPQAIAAGEMEVKAANAAYKKNLRELDNLRVAASASEAKPAGQFPLIGEEGTYPVGAKVSGRGADKNMYELKEVPISELSPAAKHDEVIAKYQQSYQKDRPFVEMNKDGGYDIVDGHHRVQADINNGKKTSLVWVMSPKESGAIKSLEPMSRAEMADRFKFLDDKFKQAEGLASWHKNLDIPSIQESGGWFGHHPLAMLEHKGLTEAGRRGAAESAFNLLPKIVERTPTVGSVPVADLVEKVGLNPVLAAEAIGVKELGELTVSEKNAAKLMGFLKPSDAKAPEGLKPILSALDSITNLTKAGQTSYPATVMRNTLSDAYKRFTGGGSAFSPLAKAQELRAGGTLEGIADRIPRFRGMTDEEATKQLWREIYQTNLMDTKKYQAVEAAGQNPLLRTVTHDQPVIGAKPLGLGESLSKHIPTAADLNPFSWESRSNPLNVRGVAGNTESKFLPTGVMQTTQNHLEELQRLATYIDASERGFNPLAAYKKVIEAHYDFGNLSNFERDVMRRIMPFYSYTRQSMPQMVGEIATNPGGRMAQTMRLMNEMQGHNQMVPEDVTRSGYAIPAGQTEDGKQRYLNTVGLPQEDLTNLISPARGALSQLNPLLRLPIETAMGRSSYNLQELPSNYPLPVGTLGNQLLNASPLARAVTSGQTAYQGLANPVDQGIPSALRLLLGARTTNVNPEQARRVAVEQFAENLLRRNPAVRSFTDVYVPQANRGQLSQEELALLTLYQQAQHNKLPK